jgi:FkbM family methyltransferase
LKRYWRLLATLRSMVAEGKPSRRGLSTAMKLCGRKLQRRWPYVSRVSAENLNLGFDDLLELQYTRTRDFGALIIGAYDGVENDPTARFLMTRHCRAVFVEPQPQPFSRLAQRIAGRPGQIAINAAIDRETGTRDLYCVPCGIDGFPAWTEQLASFQREHIVKHEDQVPGLSRHIESISVATTSFDDLLDRLQIRDLDLLQIDAEGMDAQLLAWFPFHRVKPALLHYETAHMQGDEHQALRERLRGLGYSIFLADSPTDDMAVLF